MKSRLAHRVSRLGLLSATAVILFVVESLAPRPLPWMRLGLGNLPVLLALLAYGYRPALAVSLLKLFLGGLFGGTLGGPATLIGLVAGTCSLTAMAAVRCWTPRAFSIVGVSILGAVVHQLVQLVVAAQYIGHFALFSLVPLALITGLVTGGGIGLLALWSRRRLGNVL